MSAGKAVPATRNAKKIRALLITPATSFSPNAIFKPERHGTRGLADRNCIDITRRHVKTSFAYVTIGPLTLIACLTALRGSTDDSA
jgi:hypothetical protein